VNAALAKGHSPEAWLSPRQKNLYRKLRATDASALAGLTRPEAIHALASYEHQLRARLAR
jgi:hypothetical protein